MTPLVEIVEVSIAAEIEAVRTLFQAYRKTLWAECQMSDEEWKSLPGVYVPPAGALLLGKVDGEPAGCVGLRAFAQRDTAEMKRLYVRPEFRGHSLGRKLVEAVLQQARQRGYKRIRLDTHPPTMGAAIALYRRLGFREIAADPLSPSEELSYMALELAA
jgi:ribosomal protein S18 acetylase RimI-like enzyme